MTLELRTGGFFRNQANTAILIIGVVLPEHPLYADGYRYVDQDGVKYNEVGSTQSDLFAALDLAEELDPLMIPHETMLDLRSKANALIAANKKAGKQDRFYRFVKKLNLICAGSNLTVGALIVRALPIRGALTIAAGVLGVIVDVGTDKAYAR